MKSSVQLLENCFHDRGMTWTICTQEKNFIVGLSRILLLIQPNSLNFHHCLQRDQRYG